MLLNFRNRLNESIKVNWAKDQCSVALLRLRRRLWPCPDRKILVVGCESSGTTVISHLLLRDGKARFLYEGMNGWVWKAYMSVFQDQSRVRDYPRLQLYDRLKVPGFAAILPQFIEEFPKTQIVYCIRDPRDVLTSAYRTKRVSTRQKLNDIRWVRETWLGIEEQDPVARLARRWSIYLQRSIQVPHVHFVRYEDFCADKLGTIRSLAKALDIEIDEQRIANRKDLQASARDVRNYRPQSSGSWKTSPLISQSDVRIIEEICGPQMLQWNYQLAEVNSTQTAGL